MPDLTIIGGKIASAHGLRRADITVAGGKIVSLAKLSRKQIARASKTVDARGCLVIPGAVDPHVHFQLDIAPGLRTADDFATGSRAALAGGITTVIDYTAPTGQQSPLDALAARRKQADGAIHVDYGLHNVLINWKPQWANQMDSLALQGAPSVKLFTTYRDRGWQANDVMLYQVMEACRQAGVTVCLHAENDSLIEMFAGRISPTNLGAQSLALSRPPICEIEAVARAITLAEATGVHLHLVHLSCAESARLLSNAHQRGLPISGETCPQFLALDQNKLAGPQGHLWACCPPLRDRKNRLGLQKALQQNVFQALATDHCAFSHEQKDRWAGDYRHIPCGLPGVETARSLTYTLGPDQKKLSLKQWIWLHSEGPARLFGIYPQKGCLQPGADADIVLWDQNARWRVKASRLASACDWSPYQNMQLSGRARQVLLRGQEVFKDGKLGDDLPMGKYLQRRRQKPSQLALNAFF